MEEYFRVRAELSKKALVHNIEVIKKKVEGKAGWLAVVKSNAYGHGVKNLVPVLEENGASGYAVATVEEGVEVRQLLHKEALILVLGYTHPSQYALALDYDIDLTIYTLEQATALSKAAEACGKTASVHVKLETGMGRIGFPLTEKGLEEICVMKLLPGIRLGGIFTHFARSDERDKSCAKLQLDRFLAFVGELAEKGVTFPLCHAANSAAIMEYPESFSAQLPGGARWMARAGIMLYGLYPSHEMDKEMTKLIPVMTVKSHVVHLKEVEEGTPIGYGGTFVTARKSRIATVPIGYGDGYPRHLSGKGQMLVRGELIPIAGRVCMDQTMLDVTDHPDVSLLDEVTVFGKDLPVDDLADITGTISYEIVCQLTDRIQRIMVDD